MRGRNKPWWARKRVLGPAWFALVLGLAYLWIWHSLAQPTLLRSPRSEHKVSPDALESHVRKLSEDFVPRSWRHLGNTKRTADYIRTEFASAGAGQVSDQWFEVSGFRYRNVSLLLGDADEPRIVVGAHYDGYGPYPAADDNASGVAGLIELGRLLSESPVSSPVELVAYPLEEPPYFGTREMGSWHHADSLKTKGVAIRFMISLEMIGYFSDESGSQDYPHPLLHLFYPSRGNFICVVGNRRNRTLIRSFKIGMQGSTPLPVKSISGPASIPGIDFSDHRNYWEMGFPALMITDTAFYRNRAYHTPEDTADRLDYEKMAQVVVGVYEAIRRMAPPAKRNPEPASPAEEKSDQTTP